ncbi:hypothetical protein [Chitinophaga pinensis]|uniref:Uncharacterized protein n=1 Tax=Chitinophaga pinensis (strain ATCC 43595 / DSM 2588 / LMG 13176 / NBRC 15968 / NCIMB 11800 / UQM 2034) TaxID=485918 RepID=A0A979FYP2_CHIPD|nr:hypothetical protein [Chitinophaga pinensis]ACU57541.1 hypothetical protein Cpin_0032 [Chitinophaga pinensis DSM 2588]
MKFKAPLFSKAFVYDILDRKDNRWLLFGSTILAIFFLILILRLYPYPNFLPDSYSYIDAALNNVNINMWPVGYSKFLRFISVFNRSSAGLVIFQYMLLQFSILFFLFSIKYLLAPGKWLIGTLFALLVLNPLWLYISNFVSSDALFATFSLLWLTTLFWLIYEPNIRMFVFHALILGFVFSVRYNALYYPIISILVIFMTKGVLKEKLLRIAIVLLPVAWFVTYTTLTFKEQLGVSIFSPFGGWQMGSNALFMYAHVPPKRTNIPKQFVKLHNFTIQHMDSLSKLKQRPDGELGIYYLWDEKAPLKLYLADKYKKDSTTPYLKRWASVSPLYGQYGTWLIKQHPGAFLKYYIWPNFLNYYSPPTEFLGIYNMGSDTVDPGAVSWFGYKSNKVHHFSKNKNIILTAIFPLLLAMINVIFFFGFIGFVILGGFSKVSPYYRKVLWVMLMIWLGNLAFSVLASPIVLRYQAFPFIFTLTFAVLLLGFVIQESRQESKPAEENPIPDPAI